MIGWARGSPALAPATYLISAEKRIPWHISYRQYSQHLPEDKQIRVVAIGEENTTWQKALAEKTITVATPPILIHVGDLPTCLFSPPASRAAQQLCGGPCCS